MKTFEGLSSEVQTMWWIKSASTAGHSSPSIEIALVITPFFKTIASKRTLVPFACPLGTSSLETNIRGA
ncbi:MAG: hypothetical protein ACRCZI_11635 [Cetobacterium sp.]